MNKIFYKKQKLKKHHVSRFCLVVEIARGRSVLFHLLNKKKMIFFVRRLKWRIYLLLVLNLCQTSSLPGDGWWPAGLPVGDSHKPGGLLVGGLHWPVPHPLDSTTHPPGPGYLPPCPGNFGENFHWIGP